MANITTGLKKRGSRCLYEGNYSGAVECFYRVYMMEPTDKDNIIELIYTLNQVGDYVCALTCAYAFLGTFADYEKLDTLYFLMAEAFGGAGCPEGCAKMLEKCLKFNPNGENSKDAQAFLNDLRQRFSDLSYDSDDAVISMETPNLLTDTPVLNYETFVCVHEAGQLMKNGENDKAIARIEKEFESGNFSVTLLTMAMVLATDTNDKKYLKRNAERFRFVDDYTTYEIYSLALTLNEINDDDIAYVIYRELYSKESGDKQIAFGFAVACERIGDLEHSRELAKAVYSAEGAKGPAKYYLNEIGNKSHSYVYKYEGAVEERIFDNIINGCSNRNEILEMLEHLFFAPTNVGLQILDAINTDDAFVRFELRRVAINPDVNLVVRLQAAKKINGENNVYLNIGTDIVQYSPEIELAINKFFERG